jgi:hypothetical protein
MTPQMTYEPLPAFGLFSLLLEFAVIACFAEKQGIAKLKEERREEPL